MCLYPSDWIERLLKHILKFVYWFFVSLPSALTVQLVRFFAVVTLCGSVIKVLFPLITDTIGSNDLTSIQRAKLASRYISSFKSHKSKTCQVPFNPTRALDGRRGIVLAKVFDR